MRRSEREGEKGKRSILRQILILFRIQLVAVAGLMLLCMEIMARSASFRMRTVSKDLLEIYVSQIDARLSQAWQNLSEVVYDNYAPDLLASEKEQERYYASLQLKNDLAGFVKTGDRAPMYVVADSTYGICLDSGKGDLLTAKDELRDFCLHCAKEGQPGKGWRFLSLGDEAILYRMMTGGTRAVAVFFPVSSLLSMIRQENLQSQGFLLTDEQGHVQESAGYPVLKAGQEDLPLGWEKSFFHSELILAEGNACLLCLQRKSGLFREFWASGWLLLAAVAMLLGFDSYVLRILRRKLAEPLRQATLVMGQMSGGDSSLRLPQGDSLELQTLSDSFNHLVDELLKLRIDSYEKQLALSEAEQKYIRLQIRPHFFLNAMTTISSLNAKGRTEEIQKYIDALSVNIRYMFSSGLHGVPVREEIRHVENYLEMQDLKYPDAVFSYIDFPKELEEWPIPQMLLHTLVENEFKYAIPTEGILTILIRISLHVTETGEELLQIELEDDGKGYPEEVLESFRQGADTPRKDGSRIGLYSIRRLLCLMYEREDLFVIGNVEPHGAYHRVWIPKKALHERGKILPGEE